MTSSTEIVGEYSDGTLLVREYNRPDGLIITRLETDPMITGMHTLQHARVLSAAIVKERPYLKPKETQKLSKSWQLDLHNIILDMGVI